MEHNDNEALQNNVLKKITDTFFEESRKNRRQRYIRMGIMMVIIATVFLFLRPTDEMQDRQTDAIETIADFVRPAGSIERTPVKILRNNSAVSAEEKKVAHIAIVPMNGAIVPSNVSLGNVITEKYIRDVLDHIENDDSIKAVVFVIESPGGALIPTDNIYQMIRKFDSDELITVAYVGSLAASGGYYLSLATDEIIAHPLAFVGNIGAIMQRIDISRLAQRVGIDVTMYKSGELKDMGNPFRAPTSDENAVFEELVKEGFNAFVARVEEARGEKLNQSKRDIIFDGRIFSAKAALELGLIDHTGYLDDVLWDIADKIGLKEYSHILVYKYHVKKSPWEELFVGIRSFLEGTVVSWQTPYVALQ